MNAHMSWLDVEFTESHFGDSIHGHGSKGLTHHVGTSNERCLHAHKVVHENTAFPWIKNLYCYHASKNPFIAVVIAAPHTATLLLDLAVGLAVTLGCYDY